MSKEDIVKCPTCFIPYDERKNVPLCLPCGHTYCMECVRGVQSTSVGPNSVCPICRQEFPNQQKLPKNYSVLEAAESPLPSSQKLDPEPVVEKPEEEKTPKKCIIHPRKKIKFFCLTCEEPICSKCFTLAHIRHSIEKPLNTRNEIKQSMSHLLEKCKEQLFDVTHTFRKATIKTRRIQRGREVELRQINRVFNSILEAVEKRRDFLVNTIRSSFGKLESESETQIAETRDQMRRCNKLVESLEEFMSAREKDFSKKVWGSFIEDDRENIVSLNKSGNELFCKVEKEIFAIKKEAEEIKNSDIKFPECVFNQAETMEFVKRIGVVDNVEGFTELYRVEPEYKISGNSEKESRILFFKNIGGTDTVLPYNYAKGLWEKAVKLQPSSRFVDLMEVTTLQFGDIGLTGGTKKGSMAGERTFMILRSTMKMEPMSGMINRRYFHATVELCGDLYALGGLNGKGRMNACEKISYVGGNEEVLRWQPIAGLNITRSKLSACVFDYKTIYVFGGEQFPSLEKYSVSLNTWELLPPISQMDQSYLLNTIGLYSSGHDLLILGKYFAFTYNPKTKQAQQKAKEMETALERATQYKDKIIAFTKNQPQLCLVIRIEPFEITNKRACLHPQYGAEITSNPCSVSYFE